MKTRREFIKVSSAVALGSMFLPSCASAEKPNLKNVGLQLYSVRKEMLADPVGTLKKISCYWLQGIRIGKE